MKSRSLPVLALAFSFFCLLSASGAAMTSEEAESLSQQTGRPILAVGGRTTCGLTQAVLKSLKEPAMAQLAPQYVSVFIDVDGPDFATWAKKHGRPDGTTLPFVYVVRADGESLFSHSGIMNSTELRELLVTQAAKAGRPLSAKEAAVLQKAVEEGTQAQKKGEMADVVKSLQPVKKLGPLGSLNSYAKPAVEANKLVAKLTDEGKAMLKDADEKLGKSDGKFEAALAYVKARRILAPLGTLKTELAAASRKYDHRRELADTIKQAEAIDRAQVTAASPHGKTKAVEAFQRIVSAYPDSEAAQVATKELAKLGVEGVAAPAKEAAKPALRTWADPSGKFTIEARCRTVKNGQAMLETDDGRIVYVPVEKLCDKDREYLKSNHWAE